MISKERRRVANEIGVLSRNMLPASYFFTSDGRLTKSAKVLKRLMRLARACKKRGNEAGFQGYAAAAANVYQKAFKGEDGVPLDYWLYIEHGTNCLGIMGYSSNLKTRYPVFSDLYNYESNMAKVVESKTEQSVIRGKRQYDEYANAVRKKERRINQLVREILYGGCVDPDAERELNKIEALEERADVREIVVTQSGETKIEVKYNRIMSVGIRHGCVERVIVIPQGTIAIELSNNNVSWPVLLKDRDEFETDEGRPHPHSKNNQTPCLGSEVSLIIENAIYDRDVGTIIETMLDFLASFNMEDEWGLHYGSDWKADPEWLALQDGKGDDSEN